MIEEIDDVFESSPDTEAAFSPTVKEVVSEFDKLQIELLENSVLDSTDVSIEKSVIVSGEIKQFSEEIVVSQKTNERLTEDIAEDMAEEMKESNFNAWRRSESKGSSVVEDELPSCGLASDQIESDGVNKRIESDLNQHLQIISPVEEIVTEVSVNECQTAYDFGFLTGNKDGSRELDIKKGIMNIQGKEKSPERNANGELLTLVDDPLSASFDEASLATCIEDRNYIEEFSQKIELLDILLEKESQKICTSGAQRKLALTFSPRKEKVKESEGQSSSVCSMVSESSGVYSLDRDESQQYGTEQTSQNMRNMFHSRPILDGSETVSLKVSEPVETDEEIAIASNAQKATGSCTSSVDNSTKQHADEGEAPSISDANVKDIEKEEQVGRVDANEESSFSLGRFEMPLLRKLHDAQGKSEIVASEQESIYYIPQNNSIEKNESDDRALSDELKSVVDNEEKKQNIETALESFVVVSLDDVVCHSAVEDEAIQTDSFGAENSKSGKSAAIEENAKEVNCNEAAKQKSVLTDKLLSTDFDVIDFNDLFSKLESASIADSAGQNSAISAPNSTSIGVIPPVLRKGLSSTCAMDTIGSPEQQSFLYDLPDINITPATPRRLSFDSRDPAALQSRTRSKLHGAPVLSLTPHDPPSSKVQSLVLSRVDMPLPEIHIIPPTLRRQSLGSEGDVQIAVAHGNAVNEPKDLQSEQSPPSLLSSAPSPLMPRVWNWLEESMSVDPMTPTDDTLEFDHQKEGGRPDIEGKIRPEGEKESANYHRGEEEIEPEFFELKLSEMATQRSFDEVGQIEQNSFRTFTDDIGQDDGDDEGGDEEGGDDDGGDDFVVLDDDVDWADGKSITRSRSEKLGKVQLIENEDHSKVEELENELTALSEESKSTQLKEEKLEEVRKGNEVLNAAERSEEKSMNLLERRSSSCEGLDISFDDSCNIVEKESNREIDKELPLVARNGSVFNEQLDGNSKAEQIVGKLESGESPMPFESNASSSDDSMIVLGTEKDNCNVLKSNVIDSAFNESSNFAYIEDQLKEIDAHRLALKQRRDSGAVEEVTCVVTCLDELLDNEAHDEIAAGMDAFYSKIRNCLGSMNNINELLMDGSESNDITHDSISQLKVITIV